MASPGMPRTGQGRTHSADLACILVALQAEAIELRGEEGDAEVATTQPRHVENNDSIKKDDKSEINHPYGVSTCSVLTYL